MLALVAVAATTCPGVTDTGRLAVKLALPLPSVVTFCAPRYVRPSPLPEASQLVSEKNSRRKALLAVLLSVPWIVVVPPPLAAEVKTG